MKLLLWKPQKHGATQAADDMASMQDAEEPQETASFTQTKSVLSKAFQIMGVVLICLILGLAIAIERIIFLNLASTNSQKLTAGVEEALPLKGRCSKRIMQKHQSTLASIFTKVLIV